MFDDAETTRSLVDMLALPLVVGGAVLLAAGVGRRSFRRTQIFYPSPDPERSWDPADYGIPAGAVEEHWIETPDGEQLYAWYCRAENPRGQRAVLPRQHAAISPSAPTSSRTCWRANLNVLFFDYRGFGKSSGSAVVSAACSMTASPRRGFTIRSGPHALPSILYGYSLGGAVAGAGHPPPSVRRPDPAVDVHQSHADGHARGPSARAAASPGRRSVQHARRSTQAEGPAARDPRHRRRSRSRSMAHELFDACHRAGSASTSSKADCTSDLFMRDPDALVRAISQFLAELPRNRVTFPLEAAVEDRRRGRCRTASAAPQLRRAAGKKPSVIASAPR